MRKLRVLRNIGFADAKQYGIGLGDDGMPPKEGDVIDADDKLANVLLNVMKAAEDYDATKEQQRVARVRADDEKRVAADVANRLTREELEKSAERQLKSGTPTSHTTPSTDPKKFNKLDDK